MRRPGKHHPASSPSSLPAPAAAATATTTAALKTGPKMAWKHAIVKIRGKQKMTEPTASNPENRKSRVGAAAAAPAAMDAATNKTYHNKSSLLGSKRGSFSKIGAKRARGAALLDSGQTKKSKTDEIDDTAASDPVQQCTSTVEVSSLPASSQPCSAGPEEQCVERNGTQPSDLHESSTGSAASSSSVAADGSEKKIAPLGHEKLEISNAAGTEAPICSAATNSNIRELDEDEKRLILVDFDAGMLPHEIEEKYGISKLQIADVLSNRISIFRRQVSNWSDVYALKRRRTVYVRLNMQMWEYFCQCRDQKIWLNGRQLKEQALKIANELGLHSFKASEGWLDSFKRRHCIDLRTMTGKPVLYETDLEEGKFTNDDGLEIRISRSTTPKLLRDNTNSLAMAVLDANKFLMDATDAAVLASASDSGMTSPTQATAAIQTTGPLDIQRLLPTPPIASAASAVNVSEIGASAIQALVETCCCRVNEVEVSQAVDTLRAYIVSNNINLLPVLVELQKGLSAIAAQRTATEKISNGVQQQ